MTMSERIMGAETHWLMGRVMPREFIEEVGKYLHRVAPEREDELVAAIKARAEEIAEANKDLAVDGRSEGSLAICAVVLASSETLLPLFDADERRAILYLQHAMGPVLRRPYDLIFSTLNERKDPLDKIEKACRKTVGIYPAYFELDFQRLDPGLFEMNIRRCFFRDVFDRYDARLVTTVMCAFDVNFMKAIDSLGQQPAGQHHVLKARPLR